MAKKGMKIKELAQELGITSRELIQRCRAAGIAAQNSITKLPEAKVPTIRAWYAASEPSNEPGHRPTDSPATGLV